MNPLEDAIVALRPIAPTLPFKIGDSWRPLDPTMPVGAPLTLTNPTNGNAETIPNALTDLPSPAVCAPVAPCPGFPLPELLSATPTIKSTAATRAPAAKRRRRIAGLLRFLPDMSRI